MAIPGQPTTLSVVADAMNQAIHTLNATSTSQVVLNNAASFLENVKGQLWAPAYIKDRWRVLELDLEVARRGAWNVFSLAGDGTNIMSFVRAAIENGRTEAQKRAGGAGA